MNKQNYVFLIILAIIAVGLITVVLVGEDSGPNLGNNSGKDEAPTEITLSENAKTFKLGGSHAEGFKKMAFDPFALESGEEQQVVVILNSELNAEQVEVTLKDETGESTKEMNVGTLDGQEAYFLNWKIEEINAGNYYPVTVRYNSEADESNAITLSWKAE